MAFRHNAIAQGHNNVAGLTNIENIIVDSIPFGVVEDLGLYREGVQVVRGDGQTATFGHPSIRWVTGGITIAQWHYLYNTLLSGSYSGDVTITSLLNNPTTAVNCNAILSLRNVSEYVSRQGIWLVDFEFDFSRVEVIT